MIFRIASFFSLFLITNLTFGQKLKIHKDSFNLKSDFTVRFEEDFDSQNSDGTSKDSRKRLRLRFRLGAEYNLSPFFTLGAAVRTGNVHNQQLPFISVLGENQKFSLGLEKAYVKFNKQDFSLWLGKNAFPFKSNNELFLSNNVMPKGLSASYKFDLTDSKLLSSLKLTTGHFFMSDLLSSYNTEVRLHSLQAELTDKSKRFVFFPGIFYFNGLYDQPDADGVYKQDYNILHLGSNVYLLSNRKLKIFTNYIKNLAEYSPRFGEDNKFINEDQAFTFGMGYGAKAKKGDFYLSLTGAYIEKNAVVDYFAQNDWSRWSYTDGDGRLTNFKGAEWKTEYILTKHIQLGIRAFWVGDLVKNNTHHEENKRYRFDVKIHL